MLDKKRLYAPRPCYINTHSFNLDPSMQINWLREQAAKKDNLVEPQANSSFTTNSHLS